MTSAPTGTVTFLFTDIESSTTLWQRDAAAMRLALEEHDRIVREVVDTYRGYVFSTGGDGFGIAFAAAGDALGAAAECQGRLADSKMALSLRVRMGLHSGQAEERGGNYFGLAPTRASRIMAAGAGGQILMSAAASALAGDDAPGAVRLVDLGTHRLRGIERPEHIFQAVVDGLDTPVGGLDAARQAADHVPAELDRFIGREKDLEQLSALIRSARLVTLTGVGGSGKTRLAIRLARQAGQEPGRFTDGAWFCDLSTTIGDARVPEAIGEALAVPDRPDQDATDNLISYLSRRDMLLVIDNCEHLIDEVAAVVARILAETPRVYVIATSRELLGVPGETAYPVRSLGLPAKNATTEELLGSEAVRLFADRAGFADPGFVVDTVNIGAVSEICRRLDGMPLAIELAAARVRAMAPKEIAARLAESFSLLVGPRTALPRHQTLGATIAWSHDLLDDRERALLRRLSAFAGNFSLTAAEAVGADADIPTGEVADLLLALVDKSLVVVQRSAKGTGYRLLETVRQFAAERLRESGEAPAARERHANHYFGALAAAAKAFDGPRQLELLAEYDAAESNIRTALEYLWSSGRRDEAFWTVSYLRTPWAIRRLYSDALFWGHRAQDATDADVRARVHALAAATFVLVSWGHHGLVVFGEAAAALATEQHDRALALAMLCGAYAATARREKCLATAQEAIELASAVNDRWLLGLTLFMEDYVGRVTSGHGDEEAGLRRALALFREVGDSNMAAFGEYHMGGNARVRGELSEASARIQSALDLFEITGDREGRAACMGGLARIELARGKWAEALRYSLASGAIYMDLGDASGIAGQFADAAWATLQQGDARGAAKLVVSAFSPLTNTADEVTGVRLDLDLADPLQVAAAVLAELGESRAAATCTATVTMVCARHERDLRDAGGAAAAFVRERLGEDAAEPLSDSLSGARLALGVLSRLTHAD